MILVGETADPVRFSYLTSLLKAADIDFEINDQSVGSHRTRVVGYQLFVADEDAGRARALLNNTIQSTGRTDGVAANESGPWAEVQSGPLKGWRIMPRSWQGWVAWLVVLAIVGIITASTFIAQAS